MGKVQKDTETNRDSLLRRMSAGAGDVVEKVIHFRNDDVPKYLKDLAKFEQESRKVSVSID